jgi:hypothetical protein
VRYKHRKNTWEAATKRRRYRTKAIQPAVKNRKLLLG